MAINLGEYNKQQKRLRDENYNKIGSLSLNKKINLDAYEMARQRNQPTEEDEGSGFAKSTAGIEITKGSSYFDDGYDFGDIFKTIGSTVLHGTKSVVKGALEYGEHLSETIEYGVGEVVGGVLDLLGLEEYGERARTQAEENAKHNITGAIFGENENDRNYFGKGWTEGFEEGSVIGDMGEDVLEGVGQVSMQAMASKISIPMSLITSFSNSYGSSRTQALLDGASREDSRKAGLIGGFSEMIAEQIFSGVKINGKSVLNSYGWGDKAIGAIGKGVERYFGTRAGKITLNLLDASSEGVEEIISNMLTTVFNHGVDKISKYEYGMQNSSGNLLVDLKNDLTSAESWYAFASAAMTSALIGSTGSLVSKHQKNKLLNAYAKDNGITFKEAKTQFEAVAKARTEIDNPTNFKEQMEMQSQNELALRKEMQSLKKDVKKLPIKKEVNLLTKSKIDTNQIKQDELRLKIDKNIDRQGKEIRETAKRSYLDLGTNEINELNTIADKYKGMTKEQIEKSDAKSDINSFVYKNSEIKSEEYIDNYDLKELKNTLKETTFYLGDDSIRDLGVENVTEFRKKYPNVKLVKNKQDESYHISQINDLVAHIPKYVNNSLMSHQDMFLEIAEASNQPISEKIIQKHRLTDGDIDLITNKIYKSLLNNAYSEETLTEVKEDISNKIDKRYEGKLKRLELREEAKNSLGDVLEIKDKRTGLAYQINTMKRNVRDIFKNPQVARAIYENYFQPLEKSNALINTEITEYNQKLERHKLTNEESTYFQMVGEKKYNPECELTEDVIKQYYEENKSKIDLKKSNVVETVRDMYEELYNRINEVITEYGYKPLAYREGYFPHFFEEKPETLWGKIAKKMGISKQNNLPTDIAGLTEQFRPGKTWQRFFQRRTGDTTDYNLLKGFDNYVRGAMDVIHHTENIQKLRALENELRYQYSDKGIQERIDKAYLNENLDIEEVHEQVSKITANSKDGLGNFVTELRNYTDNLANKKAFGDRNMEQMFGRNFYAVMNKLNSRVSANMVGANISSAMTNFIPITQAWSQTSTKNLLKAMRDSMKNTLKSDGFEAKSDFLINRTQQADALHKTKGQKFNDKLSIPFEAIDSFTANTIVRAKYYDNIDKGLSEQQAMTNANEFAKDVMAGRSKGDKPTIFNRKNPVVKMFTAFQLEVNNQYGYMFKDIKADLGGEGKEKLAMAFFKLFFGAYLYNLLSEEITGRKAAFSPIDIVMEDVDTIKNENISIKDKIEKIVKGKAQELPFAGGVMGGGRIPIQGAIPYNDPFSAVLNTSTDVMNLFDKNKKDTAIKNLQKEWSKPVFYLALPTAGGQIKKTLEGASMYSSKLPIAGSYTNTGKLRFEADKSFGGVAQALIFGQYAGKNAREYFDEGYQPLGEKQIKVIKDSGIKASDYRKYKKDISKKVKDKTDEETKTSITTDYINKLPLSDRQKNIFVNSEINRKNEIDMSKYNDYGSLEEYDYATKNPTKYLAISQAMDYKDFDKYKNELNDIKKNSTDKDRKKKVFDYIEGLPLNSYEKLILHKTGAGYSIKAYQNQMVKYIDGLNLTAAEKRQIHKELFE